MRYNFNLSLKSLTIYCFKVKVEPGFFKCSFLGQNIKNCEDAFTPVFTDEGICYSFNILDRGHIFNELV
jgi:hypothetical protein